MFLIFVFAGVTYFNLSMCERDSYTFRAFQSIHVQKCENGNYILNCNPKHFENDFSSVYCYSNNVLTLSPRACVSQKKCFHTLGIYFYVFVSHHPDR